MGLQISEEKVVDLLLDPENYRLGPQTGQRETILAMIEDQGPRLLDMAKDIIAEKQLSPFDLVAICPAEIPGKFMVLEGNRRVTAIKLLIEPNLAVGTSIERSIRELALKHGPTVIKECTCVHLTNKQESFRWIQKKHDTGLGGAATVPWGAMAIRRAQESLGKRHATLEVIDYVEKHGNLSQQEKEGLPKLSVTNVERILEDPAAMGLMGMSVQNGEITSKFDQGSTLRLLTRIVRDVLAKNIKAKTIYTGSDRQNYVNKILTEEAQALKQVPPWSIQSGAKVPSGTKTKTSGRGPLHSDRRYLIPSGFKIQITQPRVREIYNELRKDLRLESTPNACGVMFRVFIELSADHYIQNKSIVPKGEKLFQKLQAIAEYLAKNVLMTKHQLKPLRMAASQPDGILSTETWNAYVHNTHVMPSAKDLRRQWDMLEHVIAELWK